MTAWTVLLVAAGAAVGALLRYLADTAAKAHICGAFPWGTFAVNVAGSLILGVLVGAATILPTEVHAAVGTGLCGTLTTYSTFSYELTSLTERRIPTASLIYLLSSIVTGVLAAAAGWAAGQMIT